jgi:probable F420-dependent oxidoreductase
VTILPAPFDGRISLQVFGLAPESFTSVAQRAEARGFDTLWLSDHLVTPLTNASVYPYSESGKAGYAPETPLSDVLITAAHIAAVTSRLRIATGVFILPLRNPIATARAVETLQALSGGRFTFGVGTGWLSEEYDAVGEQFARRGARLDEMLEVMHALWSGQPVSHSGEFYSFEEIQLAPRAQAPPIYVGGSSERAFARAARAGDGWFGPACTLEASLAARARIDDERSKLGRTQPFDYAVRLEAPPTNANVRRFTDAGFEHVVVALSSVPIQQGAEAEAVDNLADSLSS